MTASWYDKGKFWGFDWKASVWDLPFLLAPVIFSHYFINERNLFDVLSHEQLAWVMQAMTLMLPWYFGYVFVRYDYNYRGFILTPVFLTFIYFLFVLVMVMVLVTMPIIMEGYTTTFGLLLVITSFFNILFIPAAYYGGYLTGKRAYLDRETGDEKYYGRWFTFALMFVMWILGFSLIAGYKGDSNVIGWTLIILVVATPVVIGIYFFKLLRAIRNGLKRAGIFGKILGVVHVILPVFISLALILFNQVAMRAVHRMEADGAPYSPSTKIIWLILLGVIPFRLYLIFTPPLRGTNLVLSVIALTVYLWTFSHNTYNPLVQERAAVQMDSALNDPANGDTIYHYDDYEQKR